MNVLVQGGLVYLIRSEFTCSRGAGWFDTNKCTCSRRAGWFDTKFLTKWMYLSKGGWFIWYEVNLLVQGGLVDLIPINVLVQGGLVDLIPNFWPNECTCPRGAGLFDTKWIYLLKGGWLIWYQLVVIPNDSHWGRGECDSEVGANVTPVPRGLNSEGTWGVSKAHLEIIKLLQNSMMIFDDVWCHIL